VRYTYWNGYGEPEYECLQSDATAVTDEDGRFTFREGKRFRFLLALGDPVYSYAICAHVAGEDIFLWGSWASGTFDDSAEIICELEAVPVENGIASRGRCKV
jgi:hypothetical protein